ncbi:MAG: metallophosphoesterase family protein [Ardenticatenaceae bacterium]|nr:metallophosphoesterase family protein [Ardenticatenaceae bacterium]
MRAAIFSDVHGNLTALEAVLADIKQQAPDMIFFAGDLCLGGARPLACLQRVREEPISCVYGNTDEEVAQRPLLSDDIRAERKALQTAVDDNLSWTQMQLSVMDRAWLQELPFYRRISPTTNPRDDIFIVHANPRDVTRHIYPPEAQQQKLYGEIKQPDDAADLSHLLHDLDTGILAFGHLHVPNIRPWHRLTLANISSVSQPLDGDPRAKYGLFTWANGRWSITHHYVAYDVQAELAQLAHIQPPGWQALHHDLQRVSQAGARSPQV